MRYTIVSFTPTSAILYRRSNKVLHENSRNGRYDGDIWLQLRFFYVTSSDHNSVVCSCTIRLQTFFDMCSYIHSGGGGGCWSSGEIVVNFARSHISYSLWCRLSRWPEEIKLRGVGSGGFMGKSSGGHMKQWNAWMKGIHTCNTFSPTFISNSFNSCMKRRSIWAVIHVFPIWEVWWQHHPTIGDTCESYLKLLASSCTISIPR